MVQVLHQYLYIGVDPFCNLDGLLRHQLPDDPPGAQKGGQEIGAATGIFDGGDPKGPGNFGKDVGPGRTGTPGPGKILYEKGKGRNFPDRIPGQSKKRKK